MLNEKATEKSIDWLKTYPFLHMKNNNIYHKLNLDDNINWLDPFPNKWNSKQLCDEVLAALSDYADKWTIIDVKVKIGMLHIYYEDGSIPREIQDKVE